MSIVLEWVVEVAGENPRIALKEKGKKAENQ